MNLGAFLDIESEVRVYCRQWPVVFARASGSYVYAEDETAYLDFFTGVATLAYGHNPPALKEVLARYIADDGIAHSLDTHTVAKRNLLEIFDRVILKPRGLEYKMMFPGPTGTNAVEAAFKLARKVKKRPGIARFTNGFHGLTLGALAATGNGLKRAAAGVPLEHMLTVPFDGYSTAESGLGLGWFRQVLEDESSGVDTPAAVIVEVVQGEGGLKAASAAWLQELARLCRDHDMLLIVDDVMMGCGRTGPFFSFESFGVTPDIVCLSKALSGFGLPISLLLFDHALDVWQPGEHSGTFRGNNHAFVTGAAALDIFWTTPSLQTRTRALSERLRGGLEAMAAASQLEPQPTVRGSGLALGLHFDDPTTSLQVVRKAFERQLLVERCGPSGRVVMTLPALTATEAEIDSGLERLGAAIETVERSGADRELVGGR